MFNSHLDSNVSLGLNILEGCAVVNRIEGNSAFGKDITEENVGDMMSCAFQMAEALKNIGVRGCYYQIAPMYHWSLTGAKRGPSFWDSIRMLHLLPRYVGANTKKGEWPLPMAFRLDTNRKVMLDGYYAEEESSGQRPLSYVPEIDKYWLGDDALDVFAILEEPLKEVLKDANDGGFGFVFPSKAVTLNRWLKEKAESGKDCITAATLYLALFFPWRVTGLIMNQPMTAVDWLFDALGDNKGVTRQNRLALLTYGPSAVREWIKKVQNA